MATNLPGWSTPACDQKIKDEARERRNNGLLTLEMAAASRQISGGYQISGHGIFHRITLTTLRQLYDFVMISGLVDH
ncbi:hypothetical protein [Undibacterium terreum]|uniref:hypothetical protein n=1 Tax=Undibacterium terreum TaxID=1224302 RepID=UPI00166C9E7B|nr:hypothetical protein [Undibacterium terreum]